MILNRLVTAGLAWIGRALFGAKMMRNRTTDRSRSARVQEHSEPAPAETQEVFAPDRDMLEALNVDESMGFSEGSR